MSIQPNLKPATCKKCNNRFLGDFTTLGMASGRAHFCNNCIANKEEVKINATRKRECSFIMRMISKLRIWGK